MMGLFGSRKKQTETYTKKDPEHRQWEEINSPEAITAFEQEQARVASMFDGERVLICGESMFLNIMVKDFTGGAANVELYLISDPEKLITKCGEFRPTILVLTADAEKDPELPARLARECPDAAIIISSVQPEALQYTPEKLKSAHVYAVLKKPFVKADFHAVIQNIKNSR